MPPQIIALCAAVVYALSFILCKRGLRHSTPITITFVSLLMQTVVLFAIVFAFTGIPSTPTFVFVLFVIAGVLQAVVRQLTYIGIEKNRRRAQRTDTGIGSIMERGDRDLFSRREDDRRHRHGAGATVNRY